MSELSRLIKLALDLKWFQGSKSLVFANCVFCVDAQEKRRQVDTSLDLCGFCICPKTCCANHSKEGLMGDFYNKYHDTKNCGLMVVKDLELDDLWKIIAEFEHFLECEDNNVQ
jgi:hypothetical protein